MNARPVTQRLVIDGSYVAYQAFGRPPPTTTLVLAAGVLTNVATRWEGEAAANLLEQAASFARVVVFDSRGIGCSGPAPESRSPYWERWSTELKGILSAIECDEVVIFAHNEAGPAAIYFAAHFPGQTSGLFLVDTAARYLVAEDYPCGVSEWSARSLVSIVQELWGTEALAKLLAPSKEEDADFIAWMTSYMNSAADAPSAGDLIGEMAGFDLRAELALIRCPTTIVNRTGHRFAPPEMGRYLADHIARSNFIELAGPDTSFYSPATSQVLDIVAEFVGTRASA